MKRYNLSQIMKDAHRFYNSKSRMGRTFGECLTISNVASNLTWSDCYNSNSKGYMGSQYCGD